MRYEFPCTTAGHWFFNQSVLQLELSAAIQHAHGSLQHVRDQQSCMSCRGGALNNNIFRSWASAKVISTFFYLFSKKIRVDMAIVPALYLKTLFESHRTFALEPLPPQLTATCGEEGTSQLDLETHNFSIMSSLFFLSPSCRDQAIASPMQGYGLHMHAIMVFCHNILATAFAGVPAQEAFKIPCSVCLMKDSNSRALGEKRGTPGQCTGVVGLK